MSLAEHLAGGVTTVCRAWAVTRRDGIVLGFTDHDRPLSFDGITFAASSGLTARAVEQTTGLAVDNTEAIGAFSDASIREADVRAGLFDGAGVLSWLVNWSDVNERQLVFRGSLGEIERSGPEFRAELRGLAEALNQPKGRVYQRNSSPGPDGTCCGFDPSAPGNWADLTVIGVDDAANLRFAGQPQFDEGWFLRGRAIVQTGASAGMVGTIKRDRDADGERIVELWEQFAVGLSVGDVVRLEPGCSGTPEDCLAKTGSLIDFRGFPHIPGEDWLLSYPVSGGPNDGGRLGG